MAYPFPRALKERVKRAPVTRLLDQTWLRQLVAQAIHLPVAAFSFLPGKSQTRFVIFGQGRSGSTLLVELLDSHPDVYCDEELLYHRLLAPVRYVEGKSRLSRAAVYGYKVKPSQLIERQDLAPRGFLADRQRAGWRIIHLTRDDVFRQTLSGLVARERQAYHNTDGETREPVRIDPDIFLDRVVDRLRYREVERDAVEGLEVLEIRYEADLLDPGAQQRTASNVFDWLGIQDSNVAARLQRVSRPDWTHDVLNHEEISSVLVRNGYDHLLPEPPD